MNRASCVTCIVEIQPGEKLSLPKSLIESVGEGRWSITIQAADDSTLATRDHNAFLNSYSATDEGLYDDYQRR